MTDTLDAQEAADMLKISVQSVRELAAAGNLPGARIGSAWVFVREDLIDWIRAQVRAQQARRREVVTSNERVATVVNRASRRRKLPELPELPEPLSQVRST